MQRSPVLSGSKLRKEIVITLVIKGLFLYLLWFLFFQEPEHPLPSHQRFEQHVFGDSHFPSSHLIGSTSMNKEP